MSLVRLKQIESGTEIAAATEYVEDNFYDKIYYDSDNGTIVITVPLTFDNPTSPGPSTPSDTDTGSSTSTVSGGDSGSSIGGGSGDSSIGGGGSGSSSVGGGGSSSSIGGGSGDSSIGGGSGSSSIGGGNSGSSGGTSAENRFATINDITNAINAVIGLIPSSYATLGHLYRLIIKLHDPNNTESVTLPGYSDSDTTTIVLPPHGGGGGGGGPGAPGGTDGIPPTDTTIISPPGMWYGQLYIDSFNTTGQKIGRFIYNKKEIVFYVDLSGYALLESPEFTGTPKIKNSNITIPTEAPAAADRDKIPTVAFVYNYFTQKLSMLPGTLEALNKIKEILATTNTPVAKLTEILATKLDKSDISIESYNADGQEIGKIKLKDTEYIFRTDFKGYAPLSSPIFTGKPQAPEPPTGSNDSQIATTKFVTTEVARIINTLPTVVEQLKQLLQQTMNDETTIQGLMVMIESKVPLVGNSKITGDIIIDGDLEVTGSIKGTFSEVSVGKADSADKDGQGNVIHEKYAPINSPAFTGIPTAIGSIPIDDDSTRLATTAFVQNLIKSLTTSTSSGGSIPDSWKNFEAVWAALNNDNNYHLTITNALAGKQPLKPALTSIGDLDTSKNNNIIYTTAKDTYNTSEITSYMLTLLNDGTPAEARETLQVVHRRRPGEYKPAEGKYGYDASAEEMRYVKIYPQSKTRYIRGEGFTFNDKRETDSTYTNWSIKSVGTSALTWLKGQEEDYKAIDSDHADVADICKYNAGTATVLRDIQNIDGIDFDGSANICRFVVDSGVANNTARTVTINSTKIAADTSISPSSTTVTNLFKLVPGARITIMFKNGCSVAKPTLNVNGTGAVSIKYRGNTLPAKAFPAGCVYDFVYYESAWHVVGTMAWTDNNVSNGQKKIASLATISDKTGEEIQYYTKGEAENTFVELRTQEYVKSVTITDDKLYYTYGDGADTNKQQIFMVAYSNKLSGIPSDGIWFDKSNEVISYNNSGSDKRFGAVYK